VYSDLTMEGVKDVPARARLLRAAAELTYANGIEASGVDAIAKRAAVTKRTLYQHFGSKDELVAAALAEADAPAIGSLRSAVDRRVAKGARPIAALFATLERLFAQPGYRGCAFLNAGLEMHDADHPVRPVVRSHTAARRELVRDLVRAEGIEDETTIDIVSLLVEASFAVSASRRDPSVAARAGRAAARAIEEARSA
jgi:AcrR family transcriptional regulator